MATQYTAGLVTGQVLTAATMNSIGATWEDWTPTVTPAAGTLTTANLVQARYAQVNKIILFRFIYFITNKGTGAGTLGFTLPVTAKSLGAGGDSGIGTGREYQTTGHQLLVGQSDTTSCFIAKYDGGAVVLSNYGISVVGMYEAA
jgi:hypothetical protein